MGSYVRRVDRRHQCQIRACRKGNATIAIGLDRAQLTWNFYCDDCAQKILEGLQEILSGPEVAEETESGPEVAEETESEKGQEYYVCKECGQKFLKPGELGEYKSHCLHAHKAAK